MLLEVAPRLFAALPLESQSTTRYCAGIHLLSFLCVLRLGEKLRFATCGFMRVLVLRRSPASGILCRVAESPVRNAAAAAETQLFRWPSKKALLEEFGLHQGCDSRGGVTNAKGSLDLGARRRASEQPFPTPRHSGNFSYWDSVGRGDFLGMPGGEQLLKK